jgi:hypothetical protein
VFSAAGKWRAASHQAQQFVRPLLSDGESREARGSMASGTRSARCLRSSRAWSFGPLLDLTVLALLPVRDDRCQRPNSEQVVRTCRQTCQGLRAGNSDRAHPPARLEPAKRFPQSASFPALSAAVGHRGSTHRESLGTISTHCAERLSVNAALGGGFAATGAFPGVRRDTLSIANPLRSDVLNHRLCTGR